MSKLYPEYFSTDFPDALDRWENMIDVTIETKPIVDQFYRYYNAGDFDSAARIIEENPILRRMMINADNMNKLLHGIMALERFFYEDVERYLMYIVKPQGDFDPSRKYTKYDVVFVARDDAKEAFMGIQVDIPAGTPPTDTRYFVPLALRGKQGASGTGLSPRGVWSSVISYYKDDCVSYGNIIWQCNKDNAGVVPREDDNTYWEALLRVPQQVVTSKTMPEGQVAGDIWIKDLGDQQHTIYRKNTDGSYGVINPSTLAGNVLFGDGTTVEAFHKHTHAKDQVGLGNVDNTSDANKPVSTAVQTSLNNKVDKVSGKGLSSNDYTTAEKNKLAGIAAGAEVNVQSDWNATSGDAFIKNKPTIPAAYTHPSTHPASMITGLATVAKTGSYNDLTNKPTITGVGVSGSGSYSEIFNYWTGHTDSKYMSNLASGYASHAEGVGSHALGSMCHVEGGVYSIEGSPEANVINSADADSKACHIEGCQNAVTNSHTCHVEGWGNTVSSSKACHVGCKSNSVSNAYATCVAGAGNKVQGGASCAVFGQNNQSNGTANLISGSSNVVSGSGSAVFGSNNTLDGTWGLLAGVGNKTLDRAGGFAFGQYNTLSGNSVAMGDSNTVSSNWSCAIGQSNTVSGTWSCAIGSSNIASGDFACAVGSQLDATYHQFVIGMGNKKSGVAHEWSSPNDDFIIGNGSSSARSNAFRINSNGAAFGRSAFNTSGADYAEMFEWSDGNPDNEDRRGRFVTLNGDKICLADENEPYILGIISSVHSASVVGNNADDQWSKMHVTDMWGEMQRHEVEYPAELDEDGNIIREAHTEYELVINPNYDPSQEYIPRANRPEWDCVGLLGQLVAVDDGTCVVNGYCKPSDGGIATASETGYRVLRRIDYTHIKILLK